MFERAGLPAVSICTDSFVPAARAMARVYGFAGYEFVTMPHPLASLTDVGLQEAAASLMPDLLRILAAA